MSVATTPKFNKPPPEAGQAPKEIDHAERWRDYDATFHPRGNQGARKDVPVFDRYTRPIEHKAHGQQNIEFRRTDADRAPPKKSMTRKLLGDPMPGRTPWAAE